MPEKTIKIDDAGGTLFIAHRGLSELYTENSEAAFTAAGECDYFGIETDIHRTADGAYVTIHDATTRRVSDRSLTVRETPLALLREARLKPRYGRTDELRIPTLEAYISICKRYEKTAVIELKGRFHRREIFEITDLISRLSYLEHCVFISFEFENLFFLRLRHPHQPAQYLATKLTFGLLLRLRLHRIDLDIKHTAVTKELVEKCHAAGIRVNCWTVNKPAAARRLIALGVDYITTNILEPAPASAQVPAVHS